jgi:hypothetical protein
VRKFGLEEINQEITLDDKGFKKATGHEKSEVKLEISEVWVEFKNSQKTLASAKSALEKLISMVEDKHSSMEVAGAEADKLEKVMGFVADVRTDLNNVRMALVRGRTTKANDPKLQDIVDQIKSLLCTASVRKASWAKMKADLQD